jgi:hypothetical protein
MTVATKVSVDLNKKGNIVLRRNGKEEVVITHPDSQLYDILHKLLVDENDYDSYCRYWGDQNAHLISWLFNLMSIDRDRKISWMFEKAIVEAK